MATIGQPGGELAHDGPLLQVAASGAPEHGDHPCVGERPSRTEESLQPVGRVGVVDDHGDPPGARLVGVDHFEPAGHRRERLEADDGRIDVDVEFRR